VDYEVFQLKAWLRQEAESHGLDIYRASQCQADRPHNSGAQPLRSGPYEEQRQYQDHARNHFSATRAKKSQRTTFKVLFQRVSSKK